MPRFLACVTTLAVLSAALWLRLPAAAQEPIVDRELAAQVDRIEQRATELFRAQRYDECRQLLEEGLQIADRLFPPEGPPSTGQLRRVGTLLRLALVCSQAGYRDAALRYLDRAATDAQRHARIEPRPEWVRKLDEISDFFEHLAEPARAARVQLTVTGLLARQLAEEGIADHWLLAERFLRVGVLSYESGERGRARPHYERALAIMLRIYPPEDHPQLYRNAAAVRRGQEVMGTVRNNWGFYLSRVGESEAAVPQLREALAIRRQLDPAGSRGCAVTLGNLGMCLLDLKRGEEAIQVLREGLELAERLNDSTEDHPQSADDLAVAHSRLGFAFHQVGDFAAAERHYQQAWELRKMLPDSAGRDAGLLAALNNLGYLALGRQQFDQARRYFGQAQEVADQLFPEDRFPHSHPDRARVALNLSELEFRSGQLTAGVEKVVEALPAFRRFVTSAAEYESEAVALGMAEVYPRVDGLLAWTRGVPAHDAAAYREVWFGKTLVTRVLERQRVARRAAQESATRAAWDHLQAARSQLARAIAGDRKLPQRLARIAELTAEKERWERTLAAQLSLPAPADPGPDELTAALPPEAAFVDLVQYLDWTQVDCRPQTRESLAQIPRRYVAFVSLRGRSPVRVELGEAEVIDRLVRRWRNQTVGRGQRGLIREREDKPADDGGAEVPGELRRSVWEPLARVLPPDVRQIYLSPDGELSELVWEALPGSRPGTVLLEELAWARVPHGLFLWQSLQSSPPAAPLDAVFAVGDVDFGSTTAAAPAWEPLPGTAAELAVLRSVLDPGQLVIATGGRATLERVLRELRRARVAHLATHGFFAADELRRDQLPTRGSEPFAVRPSAVRPGAVRSPLAYCGLVLAGANDATGDAATRITGEDILGLDLGHVRLVVLSACESGLGELGSREGTFGLPRAFHLAGCRNVVASQWPVDDEATAAIMAGFYQRLVVQHQPPLDALRHAQLAVLHHPDRLAELAGLRGPTAQQEALSATAQPPAAADTPRRRSPVSVWAAFQLSGPGR